MEKQRKIKIGIGKKLFFYFITLSLVPLIIGGSISFIVVENQLKENAKMLLSNIAFDCGRKISYYINARYQDIRLLSKADIFRSQNNEKKQKFIIEAMKADPFYEAFTVIDLNGEIIACTRKELIGDSRADREWFQKTIQSKQNEIVVLDPYYAETAGWEMVIGFNIPITGENDNEVIGVLTAKVSMDFIIQRIQTLGERTSGNNHAYLLNRKGEILAGPDEKKFLTTCHLFEYPVVKDLLAGKTGISEYKDDRGEKVLSARYVLQGDGDFDGWGWGIIVTEPGSEIFKAANIIRITMVILILTLTLLVAVIAVYFSRKLTKPIVQISDSALRIAGGDLKPIEIKYKQKDEIGELVDAFNEMSENLFTTTMSHDTLVKEVAERKLVEKSLQESKERYKKLIENQGEGIGLVNAEEQFTFANPAAESIFGVQPGKLIGCTLKDFVDPKQYKLIQNETQKRAKGEKSVYELTIIRPDKEIRNIIVTATPHLDNENKLTEIFGIFRDITERMQVETALKISEKRFRTLFDFAPDAIYINDLKGTFINGNKAAEKMLGYNKEELIGKSFIKLNILSKTQILRTLKLLAQNILGKPTGPDEFILKRKDSRKITAEILTYPVKIEGKTQVLGIARDITERKNIERILDEANVEIEKMNLDLKKTIKTKDKFFSIIAHDLKGPFNTLIGFSDLAMKEFDSRDPEEIKDMIRHIHNSSLHGFNLLNNLLEWSRSQTGQIQYEPMDFNLSDLIHENVLLISDGAYKKNIKVQNELPEQIIAHADRKMINTVIRNLISNALKFTGSGGEISISTKKGDGVLIVSVTDSGVGIKEESISTLFNLTESHSTPGTNNEKGTGLGLILCKEFVEKNGGKIWVESQRDKGSRFSFSLPQKNP